MNDLTATPGPGRYAVDPDSTCGELLRRHRLVAGITQEELAERSGYSTDYISKLERDQRRPPPIAVDRLAAVLNVADADRAALLTACGRNTARTPRLQVDPFLVVPPPAPPTPLIGRTAELAAVDAALKTSRLVTLTGVGGSGKTRLALHVARDAAADTRFPDGVAFVNLGPVRDSGLFALTIARALGLSDQPAFSTEEQISTALRSRRLLLVIDTMEHLLDEAPMLGRLLATAPEIHILTTSRVPLRLYGEHEIRLPPLALPSPKATIGTAGARTADEILASEAVQLFVTRATAAAPHFAPVGDALEAVVDICTALDGLPLAIELAAARIRLFSPEALRARLGTRLALLTDGPLDLPNRQRTLRATLDWSYDLLTSADQTLFAQLSVFEGSFDAIGAAAVCTPILPPGVVDQFAGGDTRQGQLSSSSTDAMELRLGSLVEQSLVEVTPGLIPRFRLLETLREYAATRLSESGMDENARDHHLRYYLALAEESRAFLNGPEQGVFLARLEVEHDNLRAALRHALRSEDSTLGLRLARSLGRFWQRHGHLREGLRWLDETLSRATDTADLAVRTTRAEALTGAGVLASLLGNYQRAILLDTEAVALCRSLGDSEGTARSLNALGNLALRRGDYREAAACHEEALTLSRSAGYELGVSVALGNLGRLALHRGDSEGALKLLEETLMLKRRLGDTRGVAGTLTSLGRLAVQRGEYARAVVLFEESLTLKKGLGDRHGRVTTLAHLGWVTFLLGDSDQSQALLGASLRLGQEIGARDRMAEALESLAAVAAAEGMGRDAAWIDGAAHALRAQLGHPLSPEGQTKHDEMERAARSALGEYEFALAWAAGQAQELDEVITFILDGVPAIQAGSGRE